MAEHSKGVEGKTCQTGQPNPVAKRQFAAAGISPAQIPFILIGIFLNSNLISMSQGEHPLFSCCKLTALHTLEAMSLNKKEFSSSGLWPAGAVVHTACRRNVLDFRASLSVAYCLFSYSELLSCPSTNL